MQQETHIKPSAFAQQTNYSLNHVYRLIKAGHIRAIRMPSGYYRIPASELDRILGGGSRDE